MALVSSRGVSLVMTILMDIVTVVIIVSVIVGSIITSMQASIFFTSQRRSSCFTINASDLRLMMGCYLSMVSRGVGLRHYVLRIGRWRVCVY